MRVTYNPTNIKGKEIKVIEKIEPNTVAVIDDSDDIEPPTEQENENEGLSDKFLYGYLITCGVIITVLKIIT